MSESRMGIGRRALAPTVALALSGCMLVDAYSDRAVRYNLEAEQTQDQDLLLNIARASLRRPLQFSGVQSVTGTASASGNAMFTFPFGRKQGPNTFSTTEGISGGQTFAVAVLDTQEFFQGILKPIPLSTLDFYVQERYPRSLLFNIFISKITVRQGDKTKEFPNYPGSDRELDAFQYLITQLLNQGMTTQQRPSTAAWGPVLTPTDSLKLDVSKFGSGSGFEVKTVTWCDLSETDRRNTISRLGLVNPTPNIDTILASLGHACDASSPMPVTQDMIKNVKDATLVLYRIQKSDKSFTLCFDRRFGDVSTPDKDSLQSKFPCREPKRPGRGVAELDTGMAFRGITLGISETKIEERLNPQPRNQESGAASAETRPGIDFSKLVDLELTPRSTEGVIYYLGEVVRRQNKPDFHQPKRIVMIPFARANTLLPEDACRQAKGAQAPDTTCRPLLVVVEHGLTDAFISVLYDGTRYAIPRDPEDAGQSYQVLDLVLQLFALNKSAKDLPTTSVFTLVSP